MMTKRVVGMLAVIALLGVSATGVEAGFGSKPSALTSFFVCKSISGDDPEQRVDATDSTSPGAGWGLALQNVKVGAATLACAFTSLFPAGQTTEKDANPDLSRTNFKCYSVSVPRGQQPGHSTYTATDEFFPSGTPVSSSSVQLICAPAQFTQP
jgi:hypothetical protein